MKHSDIISKMDLKEKAAFLSGKSEWETRSFSRHHIPSIFLSDGPSGIRKQAGEGDHLGLNPSVPATCFPSSATLSNSWDEALLEQVGVALGEEAMAEEVNVLLGPGFNIKRNPLCGRNFEYISEDPYVAGKLAAAEIRGIQSQGVSACAKHFAVNSQEARRMAMNSVVDERTLREIYLTAFEIAVKEGKAKSIMSSYNEVNGTYANENAHLLKEILRDEWGFDGFVVTDWGASNDHALGVKNGSALEMPNPGLDPARELLEAVKSGKISESDIDERVDELLDAVLTLSKNAKVYKEGKGKSLNKEVLHAQHHEIAKRAAAESAVLLKNEGNLLPLSKKAKVAVIGDFAFVPRYQGAGSSMVNSTKVESIVEVLGDYDLNVVGKSKGYNRAGKDDEALTNEAVELAKQADVVLYFFGLNEQSESEGLDRKHLQIPANQIALAGKLKAANANLVGVISAGSVIEMPWRTEFKAILHGYLGGQAGAGAMLDVLTGAVNPSGKLTETFLEEYEQTPSYQYYPAKERNSEYRESIYVGYRYFEKAGVPVAYPFGFGLSYTEFSYGPVTVTKDGASFTIKNTGKTDGAEVAQLYVALPNAKVFRPAKELKGFAKVFLKAGEEKTVKIAFDDKTFRYWNIKTNRWEIEGGTYSILVGSSSCDIRRKAELSVAGTTQKLPYENKKMTAYETGEIQNVSDEEFANLLGYAIPDGSWSKELGINDSLGQMSYAKNGLARFAGNFLANKIKKNEESGDAPDLNTLFQYNMPFRAIAKMTGGAVSMDMVEGMVTLVNHHGLRGLGRVIGGFFANSKANKKYEEDLKNLGNE